MAHCSLLTSLAYANCWLNLVYKNAKGKKSDARVVPLGLVHQGARMYLVHRFAGYDNERNLALHRIHHASMTLQQFDRPETFDLKAYDEDGRFGFGDGKKIKLSFRIHKDAGLHLLESPLSLNQKVVERIDQTLDITASVIDSAMLDRWLRGFGEDVSRIKKLSMD